MELSAAISHCVARARAPASWQERLGALADVQTIAPLSNSTWPSSRKSAPGRMAAGAIFGLVLIALPSRRLR